MKPSELRQGPLAQFQTAVADRSGTLELLATINAALGPDGLPEARLARVFESSWPRLEQTLQTLPVSADRPLPTQEEMIVEVLEKVRGLHRGLLAPATDVAKIQFYSCFISYSQRDEEFARRLHARLQEEGVRVWFAPEDTRAGRKLYDQIDEAIRVYDRVLLVLSEGSMRSSWVATEIQNARKRERKEGKQVLFPIRLVDFDTIRAWVEFDPDPGMDAAREIREYFIPDFSNWKNPDDFEAAFARLLKDLKASA
jgi:hypothetical protein